MENPFSKFSNESGEQGITEDLERQLNEAKQKLEEAEDDEERERLGEEIKGIEAAISEISR